MLRSNELKYIYRTRYDDQFYDLVRDPTEERSLLYSPGFDAGSTSRYKELITDWLKDTPLETESDLNIDP